jgi:hypothetical protein
MTKHDGGKGDAPRPFSVGLDKFDKQFDAIFGKKEYKVHCPVCGKSPTWCVCKEKKDE